jgi:hypothetical protein
MSILKIRWAIFVIFALWGFWSAKARAGEDLPVNPAVRPGSDLALSVCLPGWSETQRAPQSYMHQVKMRMIYAAGLPPESAFNLIADHRIPVVLAGSPTDPRNIVLQDRDSSLVKDREEAKLRRMVCSGEISLRAAQEKMWAWRDGML